MKPRQLFQSATVRLSAVYVLILVGICLVYSVAIFQIATRELERGLHPAPRLLLHAPRVKQLIDDPLFAEQREQLLVEGRRSLVLGLVGVDGLILVLGGLGSYYLARRTLKPIQTAHEAQERFAADASHELRTPLAAIRTETEVGLRDPNLTLVQAKQLLQSNLEESKKLSDLVATLLRLARQQHAGVGDRVDLGAVVARAVTRARQQLTSSGVTIQADQGANVTVAGDARMLEELLAILLENAVQHSTRGQTVRVAVGADARHAELVVADEGRGISEHDLPHVFDRFFRGDAARSSDGYGLGLSIARQIVDAHNGTIRAESADGRGARFTVRLPR